MSRENTSSVDMNSGKKLAFYANRERKATKSEFKSENTNSAEQIINARKAANLATAKAKAKKKAKLAKASRKKNKK